LWVRERLDRELQLVGKYGLKNKREVWRTQLVLATIRKKARELLVLDERDTKRVIEGAALLRRLTRLGVIEESQQRLDFLLSLTPEKFLDRRLQTRVSEILGKSIHESRNLVFGSHIRVAKRIVNIPSFMVRVSSDAFIGIAPYSAHRKASGASVRLGRRAKRNASE
jgi:small subunit ribosomal protein S9e